MTETKPKHRWFRFSLRTLLVLMTVLCVWLGFKVNAARRQKEAVLAIREAGAMILFDYQLTPVPGSKQKKFDATRSPPAPVWLRKLLGDESFGNVTIVQLHTLDLPGPPGRLDLSLLQNLPTLASLVVRSDELCDNDLVKIGGLRSLKLLSLDARHLTDEGLAHLQSLTELGSLDLGFSSNITDAGLRSLRGLKKLTNLVIVRSAVTDEGVREFQNALPNCDFVR
jgi:hypothetical protein